MANLDFWMTLSSKCCPKSITFSDKILISATQLVTPRQGDTHRLDRSSNTSVDPKLVDTGSVFFWLFLMGKHGGMPGLMGKHGSSTTLLGI